MSHFHCHHRTVRRPASPNIKAGEDRAAGALDAMWMARGISDLERGYRSPAPHTFYPSYFSCSCCSVAPFVPPAPPCWEEDSVSLEWELSVRDCEGAGEDCLLGQGGGGQEGVHLGKGEFRPQQPWLAIKSYKSYVIMRVLKTVRRH